MAKLRPEVKLNLPSVILDLHCHGRDWGHRHKTTVLRVLEEAAAAGIGITAFMPNTSPAITDLSRTNAYLDIINRASTDTGNRRMQYLYFGATDANHSDCVRALKLEQVIGVKLYPLHDGNAVTTGVEIGISKMINALLHMEIAAAYGKVVAVHCDDPETIAAEGNTKKAEVEYVAKMLGLARAVKGVRLVICHVSCRESAELILHAQANGLDVGIELAPHYLWFDNEGTNWHVDIPSPYYHCFNNLRSKADREYLTALAFTDNRRVFIHSDSACHTLEEKENGAGGIPSNQQLIKVAVTLAVKHGASEARLQQLLCFNAAEFYHIPVPKTVTTTTFRLLSDHTVYNDAKVRNPWRGSLLYTASKEKI